MEREGRKEGRQVFKNKIITATDGQRDGILPISRYQLGNACKPYMFI
jgi:hypothetical protein